MIADRVRKTPKDAPQTPGSIRGHRSHGPADSAAARSNLKPSPDRVDLSRQGLTPAQGLWHGQRADCTGQGVRPHGRRSDRHAAITYS